MSAGDETRERFERFAKEGYHMIPASYQIRNPDMTAGPWKAQVQIFKDFGSQTKGLSLSARTKTTYPSKDAADAAALLMGLRWLKLREAKALDPFSEPLEEGIDGDGHPFRVALLRKLDEKPRA